MDKKSVVNKILDDFEKSSLHINPVVSTEQVKTYLSLLVEWLERNASKDVRKGSPESRGMERTTCSFSAQLSSYDLDPFFLYAFFQSVCDHSAYDAAQVESIRWLERLAVYSFFNASMADQRANMQTLLEESTPLVKLSKDIPCLFLMGSPESSALSGILGKLFFFQMRLGCSDVIISVENCDLAVLNNKAVWSTFHEHVSKASLRVFWVGQKETLLKEPLPLACIERFDSVGLAHTAILAKRQQVS